MQMPAITERDKRAVVLLGISLAVFGAIYFWPEKKPEASRTVFSVPQAEKRLERMSRQAAALPAREEMLKKAKDELSRREKGILVADTPAQAQAKLLEIIRRVARSQQPPIMLRGGEFREVKPLGSAYGEVSVAVQIEAGIEQILNFMADIGNQPELIALSDASFSQVTNKQKLVPTRITVTGIVPRALVPRKEAGF